MYKRNWQINLSKPLYTTRCDERVKSEKKLQALMNEGHSIPKVKYLKYFK